MVDIPIWPTLDAIFDSTQILTAGVGDSVSITVCIANTGDAALGSPVYAALYKDRVDPANFITFDSISGLIQPGKTRCLTLGVANIRPHLPFAQLAVRLNDRGGTSYPVQPECPQGTGDSVRAEPNPVIRLMMEKHATLNGVPHDSMYANPVSALYSDSIEYEITAVNANLSAGRVVITDTLPPYLKYNSGARVELSNGAPLVALTGTLHRQQTILAAGTMKLRLTPGIYIVTLNGGIGQKIFITEN
jgi:hypothetical protein